MKLVYKALIPLIVLLALGTQAIILAQEKPIYSNIRSIQFSGGTEDDHALALLASGLKVSEIYRPENQAIYIKAIMLTDRFRQVEIQTNQAGSLLELSIFLVPWPTVKRHRGINPLIDSTILAKDFNRLPVDRSIGDIELEKWRQDLIRLGSERGYPNLKLNFSRSAIAEEINWDLQLGNPSQIQKISIRNADKNPIIKKIESLLTSTIARDLWSETLRSRLSRNLEKILLNGHYFQSTFDFSYDDNGLLVLELQLGKRTEIKYKGELLGPWVGTKSLKEIIGFTALVSPSSDMVELVKFRLDKFYKEQGYLKVQTICTLEKLDEESSNTASQLLRLEVSKGPLFYIGNQTFQGNINFSEQDIMTFVTRTMPLKKTKDPFQDIKKIQLQIMTFYDAQGYLDMKLIPETNLDVANPRVNVTWTIEEGQKMESKQFSLDYAKGLPLTPDYLKSSLSLLIMNQASDNDLITSDRPFTPSRKGRYEATARKESDISLTLYLDETIPISKALLSEVHSDLRFKLARAGFKNPIINIDIQNGLVKFAIPTQSADTINRIIVRGLDTTRANTVLNQLKIQPNYPVDPQRFSASQINLSSLNAFDLVDFESLEKVKSEKIVWKRGDVLLNLEEKKRWDYTTGFGYDRSQGYYFIGGIRRNNIDGQGRAIDFTIRAGDKTIQNETLRKWFPTGQGQNNRSIDTYALGYNDPSPGFIHDWFDLKVNWRTQAAYIEESQAAYFARRRVVTSEFEWRSANIQYRLGERYERTDFNPQSYQINLSDFLLDVARVNKQSYIISAPYFMATIEGRDRPIDPTKGYYFSSRFDLATQLTGTSRDSSYLKVDLRAQWNFSVGMDARYGVFMISSRLGVVRPTVSAIELPLSERFYGGGPNSVRGVGSDLLGPVVNIQLRNVQGQPIPGSYQYVPTGGEMLSFASMEYRFPVWGQDVWAEIFVDSGQVYSKLNPGPRLSQDSAPFPAWRTTIGVGLIFKIGIPVKIEYAQDFKKLLSKPRTPIEIQTELRGILISAGYQF